MDSPRRAFLEWTVIVVTLILIGYTISSYVVSGQARQAASVASIKEVANVGGSGFRWNAQLSDGDAPDFQASARDGKTINLSAYRGRVVFLNFWATTCIPCRKEIPDLSKLSEKMAGLPFVILAISTDRSWSAVDEMFPNKPKGIQIALDPSGGEIKRRFGTDKIPESYVIDKKGQLRMRFVNVHPWDDERIHRYLETLANES